MLKQFLSKLPRKASNLDSDESNRVDSLRSDSSAVKNHRLHGGNNNNNTVKRTSSSAVFPASTVSGIEPLVPFKDVPNGERTNLLVSKLSLCCVTFDFTDPSKSIFEKDVKKRTLVELVDFVANGNTRFSEPAILAMCRMCAINLFRVFSPNYRLNRGGGSGGGENDDEPTFDPAWPHLQLVYELFLKFISSSCLDAKVAKKYIDHWFISRLLDLFDSEDPRERDCLKTILHRVYETFMVHRPFIRKSINNVFFRFVFETEKHNGVAELLEIFGSIISGFALPLKDEHKMFLWRVLIPLHKPKSMAVYSHQLSYCVTQFIEKEPKLASTVIRGMLKYWPITNSQKEVMFLGELEEILDAINMVEFQNVMVPLFWRIGYCINSLHFQVAERALFLWNNDHIVNLIARNRQVILPIIFPALDRNSQSHWNQAVLNLTHNIRKMFMEMDEKLYLSCHSHFKEEEAMSSTANEKQKEAWKQLERVASLRPVIGNTAVLVSPI
ncbi:PREDICTED: serine/threonine protein phosphatase 2A 57 kDa regulatory subunit B' iota isoform-like isoform X1 [Lupinus angustifolius]|uniref:serine/threonine protein phosphatase 2A 57 kDa regulatory subunit B' iota isoform-like isoform X1 n=1 Tax=Lupinus angustifolius TaxID=3871 RepID=UPI00092E242D|nr:PREDICTED: serine/threonine protein phosphatase 2A 57 kDa regulatory subunit B' iota isoform-like isoform X1 [Lupinus angustifolius]